MIKHAVRAGVGIVAGMAVASLLSTAGLADTPFGPSYKPSDTKESIFTMMPKQLGLKLDKQQGSVDMLVIEHAELPADLRAKEPRNSLEAAPPSVHLIM
jgi:hypothetical protein